MTQARKGDWIQTFTGKQFWPLDPRPEEIDIRDIAHALSMLCRYNGHCLHFYSVAEHSILVSKHVSAENALWGLLHDAAEGLGAADLLRPVKKNVSGYHKIEAGLQLATAVRFNLPVDIPAEVHEIDQRMLMDEKAVMMLPAPAPWQTDLEPVGAKIEFMSPARAERAFLDRFNELYPRTRSR